MITSKGYGDFTKITIGPIYAKNDSVRRNKGNEVLIIEDNTSDACYIYLKVKDMGFSELEKLAEKILKELEDGQTR